MDYQKVKGQRTDSEVREQVRKDPSNRRLLEVVNIETSKLQPHPKNKELYGLQDLTDLNTFLEDERWLKPLVVTPLEIEGNLYKREKEDEDELKTNIPYIIISGVRRWYAAREKGLEMVPCIIHKYGTYDKELSRILLENAQKVKNREQMTREGQMWYNIKKRTIIITEDMRNKYKMSKKDKEKFRDHYINSVRKPKSEEIKASKKEILIDWYEEIAKKVGLMNYRTLIRCKRVVKQIDKYETEGKNELANVLRAALNDFSVRSAHMLLSLPDNVIEEIGLRIHMVNSNTQFLRLMDLVIKNYERLLATRSKKVAMESNYALYQCSLEEAIEDLERGIIHCAILDDRKGRIRKDNVEALIKKCSPKATYYILCRSGRALTLKQELELLFKCEGQLLILVTSHNIGATAQSYDNIYDCILFFNPSGNTLFYMKKPDVIHTGYGNESVLIEYIVKNSLFEMEWVLHYPSGDGRDLEAVLKNSRCLVGIEPSIKKFVECEKNLRIFKELYDR